jgi:hypothetical protein|uniref:Uncharacterized protein n=1 Tax=Zea mays TaxID=4577 RepID=C0PB11_MAIZE|nr:unknown [Zea mays]
MEASEEQGLHDAGEELGTAAMGRDSRPASWRPRLGQRSTGSGQGTPANRGTRAGSWAWRAGEEKPRGLRSGQASRGKQGAGRWNPSQGRAPWPGRGNWKGAASSTTRRGRGWRPWASAGEKHLLPPSSTGAGIGVAVRRPPTISVEERWASSRARLWRSEVPGASSAGGGCAQGPGAHRWELAGGRGRAAG